ncbi:MAG TPA: 2-oxoacid:acceptor oxidoreductase subunit alpha [Methanothrix sp.]|nr:2-oxoacid:acceptor oxidoreductase subunit alpha [Methanothrix sp.]HPJ85253.1 2-oxoacid:acceptor oxidoreductase subunit alpha [Methanothrix sp.]HPR67299.1 2-oxoacid:acceptor oxidoreductase subunit alpha [Methanothrix sp.]
MDEFSVLVGGRAGDGINEAGMIIARLFNQLGYCLYQYLDYPSLIRGGHNFAIVRAAGKKIGAHRDRVDFLLALNQETIDRHRWRLKEGSVVIYDSDEVKSPVAGGVGLPLKTMAKEAGAPAIARNSGLIGAFSGAAGIEWDILEAVLRKEIPKSIDENLEVARLGRDGIDGNGLKVERRSYPCCPVITGNELIGLGLLRGGLDAYVAYPMTPSSGILHFLAKVAGEFSIKVVHPENEIAVILMAQGFAYAGKKVALGTSGGGFCLMTEGMSLAGMAEMPLVVVVSMRAGPSTGVPTYTAQSDLHFVMNAGQGEFTRLVIAPGDLEQAYYWSATSLGLAWKYQIPAILLSDKTLSESAYSFNLDEARGIPDIRPVLADGEGEYKRYARTPDGVSPLAFPSMKGAVVKANGYAHLESGITTEDADEVKAVQDKSLRKEESLKKELERLPIVRTYGSEDASLALVCWGSNKPVCAEVGEKLGLRVVQPVVLNPFPTSQFEAALGVVERMISVETNSTGQLARLMRCNGFDPDDLILKYDARPFSVEDLEERLLEVTR